MQGMIAIPGRERGRWASFGDCLDVLERPADVVVRRSPATGGSIAYARNVAAQEALDGGAEWVFFLDDDLMFRTTVLTRLLAHPEPVVMGLTMMRYRVNGDAEFRPIWTDKDVLPKPYPTRLHWEPVSHLVLEANGMMRLTAGTSGGLLVRRTVFETIPPPWWTLGQMSADVPAEDLEFCYRVRAHGFDVWGDPKVHFGHTTAITLWPHQMENGDWATVLAHGFDPFLMQPWPTKEPVLS